jgi:hypothetical protein
MPCNPPHGHSTLFNKIWHVLFLTGTRHSSLQNMPCILPQSHPLCSPQNRTLIFPHRHSTIFKTK